MNRLETTEGEEWDLVIQPKSGWWDVPLGDIWRYRDLLVLFVRRDFVAEYKQTILGPLWFIIQPILMTLMFTVIFGNVASIPTDGLPKVLFYMSGIVGWNYFSECLNKTSTTFTTNANLFGKVYFPRIITPLSVVISNMIKFGIQYFLFLGFLGYYAWQGAAIQPNMLILITPLLILIMAGMGLGFGMIISALTTKYRDFKFLIIFGIQLWMYATPIVYPLSEVPQEYQWLIMANPMTSVIETFKFAYLGAATFNPWHLLYTGVFTLVILVSGVLVFNKVEKNFMDTV